MKVDVGGPHIVRRCAGIFIAGCSQPKKKNRTNYWSGFCVPTKKIKKLSQLVLGVVMFQVFGEVAGMF
jgi:hypothetical protein